MSGFDPFRDFATRGYLRNSRGLKDLDAVKRFEHVAFRLNLDSAIKALRYKAELDYQDILDTHKRLFSPVYPWAGMDRLETAPNLTISKGVWRNPFASPQEVRLAAQYALRLGSDPEGVRKTPGTIMGQLAFAHPFLDGNGRTIMLIHGEICRRAGIHIDWRRVEKNAYLRALTEELERPGKALDTFLQPYTQRGALKLLEAGNVLRSMKGLGPDEQAVLPSMTHLVPARNVEKPVIDEAAILRSAAVREAFERMRHHAGQVFAQPERAIVHVKQAAFDADIGDRSGIRDAMLNEQSGPRTQNTRQWNQWQCSVDDLWRAVHSVREKMEHEASRNAHQAAIPQPSESLLKAIGDKLSLTEEQARDLNAIHDAFDRRFGHDVANLRGGRDLERIGQAHGLAPDQLEGIRSILKVLDDGMRSQRKEMAAQREIGEEQDLSRKL